MILKLVNNEKTYEFNVTDLNEGVKLYYHFEIPTVDIPDGKYNMQLLDGETVIYEDIVCIGDFKGATIQYKRGENIYINAPLDGKFEDVTVEITATQTTVYPNDGFDAMTSVVIDATPVYDDGYNSGNADGYNTGKQDGIEIGYNSGYTDGSEQGYNNGFNNGVADQKAKLTSISIKNNGTFRNENGYSEVIVEVGNEQANYGYKTNWVDEDGLREIGWNDEDIALFKNNISHYQWENYKYVVSDENKALYNELTKDNIVQHKDDPNLVFMPKLPLLSQITTLEGFRYLKGIPYFDFTQYNGIFQLSNNLSLETIPLLDFSDRVKIDNIFGGCRSIENLPMLDFSNVQSGYGAFSYTMIETTPQYDFSNCKNFDAMFSDCPSLIHLPDLNIKSAISTQRMFSSCSSLMEVPPMDLSNVINASRMFEECGTIQKISHLNLCSATNISYLFYECGGLKEVEGVETDSATNVEYMFYGCRNLTKLPSLNFENVTNINNLFGYVSFNNLTDFGGLIGLKINWESNGLVRCPNLSYESCINILNGLADVTELGGRTLKVNSNFLTTVGNEISIGTSKGWTITA